MNSILLSTAYLAPVSYFSLLKNAASAEIEREEHYLKQSYRNRCVILAANGTLPLSIPVIHNHTKELVKDTRISYAENWQKQHWRTLESAYRNSPYYVYYADELRVCFEKKYAYLLEFNMELLMLFKKFFKLNTSITMSSVFKEPNSANDFRYTLHPKIQIRPSDYKTYPQLFSDKFGFQANLSCIDLLFNTGPQAAFFL